jgi:hypothetical protein
MYNIPSSCTHISDPHSDTASDATIPCPERRARMKAKRAAFRAFLEDSKRRRAEHESSMSKIQDEFKRSHPDVDFPTNERMKAFVHESKALQTELNSVLEVAFLHNQYLASEPTAENMSSSVVSTELQ